MNEYLFLTSCAVYNNQKNVMDKSDFQGKLYFIRSITSEPRYPTQVLSYCINVHSRHCPYYVSLSPPPPPFLNSIKKGDNEIEHLKSRFGKAKIDAPGWIETRTFVVFACELNTSLSISIIKNCWNYSCKFGKWIHIRSYVHHSGVKWTSHADARVPVFMHLGACLWNAPVSVWKVLKSQPVCWT